jgi:hypothetical protein
MLTLLANVFTCSSMIPASELRPGNGRKAELSKPSQNTMLCSMHGLRIEEGLVAPCNFHSLTQFI